MRNTHCGWALFVLMAVCALVAGPLVARARIVEAGGSMYLAMGLDPDALKSERDWQKSKLFKTVSCAADDIAADVTPDLRAMFDAGQRKVGVMVWHAHLGDSRICDGYLLNSSNPAAQALAIRNLAAFVEIAGRAGLNEVQIRFAPQWINNPRVWTVWNEALYQENLAFMQAIVASLGEEKGTKIVFDLGAELGGLEGKPQVETYVKRTWATVAPVIGVARTYGFSIAYAQGRISRLVKWLTAAGPLPVEFALDIYKQPYRRLVSAAKEARESGVAKPVFLIQETYYDDPAAYSSFVSASQDEHVTIRAIMQWPKRRGAKQQISESKTPEYIYPPVE